VRDELAVVSIAKPLAAETLLKGEKLGLKFSQGLTELCQFFFGAVNFKTPEFGNLEGLLQQPTFVPGCHRFFLLVSHFILAFSPVDISALDAVMLD
jgi:hypothetical protein